MKKKITFILVLTMIISISATSFASEPELISDEILLERIKAISGYWFYKSKSATYVLLIGINSLDNSYEANLSCYDPEDGTVTTFTRNDIRFDPSNENAFFMINQANNVTSVTINDGKLYASFIGDKVSYERIYERIFE